MPRALSEAEIQAFRERLCDAAEKLFAEHGVEAVTVRELAGALGVSPMTPYRYFKDKDAILAAVRARSYNRFAEALEGAYAANAADPARAAEAVGRAYVDFAFSRPEAYKLMFDINQPSEFLYPEFVRAGQRAYGTLTRHVGEVRGPDGAPADPELVGRAYWAALHGPIMLQFAGRLDPAYGASQLISVITDALASYWRRS
ncbi:MAG: TetR/AcrR family transcriptional regulator [Caulobacteraceae bacterium]